MLDQVASLLRVMPQEWYIGGISFFFVQRFVFVFFFVRDDAFAARLVDAMSSTVVDRIYMPAAAKATTSGYVGIAIFLFSSRIFPARHFKTQVDIKLRAWANEELPLLCSRARRLITYLIM